MDAIIAALTDQQAELAGLVAGLSEADWQRPSPCEGWTVSDVVLHLAQTNEMAAGSASGRFAEAITTLTAGAAPASSIDDGADLMVSHQRGESGAAVRARWQASAAKLRQQLLACDPHQRVTWVAGELSVRTLATTRLAETWIHTGDVAEALGGTLMPTDRLWHIARLAWRTLPYAFAREGRELTGGVALELRGPSGEAWNFVPEIEAKTFVRGDALDLCLVAARRVKPEDTKLRGRGPDAEGVLDLMRTYA